MADAHRLEHVLNQSGYTAVHTERLTVTLEYASIDEFIHERQATSATLRTLLEDVPALEQEAIWRTVTDAVRPYADAAGIIRMPNDVLCVVGQGGD